MAAEKARKFSLTRQAIRLLNKAETDTKARSELKRIGVIDVLDSYETPSDGRDSESEEHIAKASKSEASDSLQDEELLHKEFNGFEEAIPEPNTTPFPRSNVRRFPQETKLSGIRGQTICLETLFPSENTIGLAPYVAALHSE
ncbi:hypothetical protein F443_08085 [Phytophthora nicotianae P1569]|uniref:Uncharacterized protein n=1 Tax=Phytophthora nicotianae P1569 TaxID=1317065 RepID=V9F9M9_PHYNI|nr:hypothetical protein F443_08085 [Phytophthora nicotianae P1569]